MSGKLRAQPKMAARKGGKDSRATVIMFRNKAMSQTLPVQPKTGVRKSKSARTESLIALEQAHREELERTHLQYTERIRQVEAARLENERKLEQQQDFHANLSEQYRGEVKQRTTELLAAKDLLRKATEGTAAVEKRLAQVESQRGALEREQRALHEALQTVQEQHAAQVKAATQLQAQRDALVTERRTLHETLQTLREQHAAQVKAATQLQAQRDALVTERRTLHETLQTLREQHRGQGKGGKPAINAPPPGEGPVKSAGLDPIPLPVGRNSMTEEEKTLFAEKLDCAIKTGGVPALETRGAAQLHQDPALLEKANQLVDRLESIQETVGAGDQRFIDEVRGRAMNSPLRLLIFGSCVSRDILNYQQGDTQLVLVDYYARSSIASMGARPIEMPSTVQSISSKFQRKMVERDIRKDFLNDLAGLQFDLLLIDLIDERFTLYVEPDGGVCTLSLELSSTGFPSDSGKGSRISSGSEEFWRLWEAGWLILVNKLKCLGGLDRLRVNQVFWSSRTANGGNFEPHYSYRQIDSANQFLDRMYQRISADIPPGQFLRFDHRLMAGSITHKWGISPFHYVDAYYHAAIQQLCGCFGPERRKRDND